MACPGRSIGSEKKEKSLSLHLRLVLRTDTACNNILKKQTKNQNSNNKTNFGKKDKSDVQTVQFSIANHKTYKETGKYCPSKGKKNKQKCSWKKKQNTKKPQKPGRGSTRQRL